MFVKALLAIAMGMLATPALAQESTPSPMVNAELLLDAPADAKAGDAVWAGVRFTIPQHWHIYWQNPGDSGIPTTLKWTLPEGVQAGEIVWPAPERQPMSGLVNYGYSDEVVLPVPLTYTADAVSGEVVVKADWLVCQEICIPESATLTATLPHPDAQARDVIEAARAQEPQPFPGSASFSTNENAVQLALRPSGDWEMPTRAEFMPLEDGVMKNSALPEISATTDGFSLTLARGSAALPTEWHGVVRLAWSGKEPVAYAVTATPGVAPLVTGMPQLVPLHVILLLAFVGGLLLNIMPCVLPILSLKALALVKKADAAPRLARVQGFAYTFGVVLSFILIAGAMLALKASGEAVGWGFQLQSPITVGVLAVLMLLVTLNLLGLFHLPPVLGRVMVSDDGVRGTFLTGVLAVAVATPCTAPFMATAVGATLTLPPMLTLLVFAAMGLGMAAPFLLIGLWPAARRLLPKPGTWMNRFRHFLAIPMGATAAWLFYVLVQLLHPTPMQQEGTYSLITPVPYSEQALADLRAQGRPVFVDATAAWCITCKVNERVALAPEGTQRFFAEHDITLMIADWTARDETIAAYLATFGRNGVPLYVFYPPSGAPVVLPQMLSPGLVKDTLRANLTRL